MEIAILAALSMLVQDVFEAMKILSLARHHGWMAGFSDAVMWLMMFFSMDEAITKTGSGKLLIIVLVTIANVLGQKLGQVMGDKFIKEVV